MSFISKLWNNIKALFGKLPAELKAAVHVGVVVTENIKKIVDSPLVDVLTAIIPGEFDDMLKNRLRTWIPFFLVELRLVDGALQEDNLDELTAKAMKCLQGLDATVKPAIYHSLSILIAQLASDGKLSWSDGVSIVQWYYKNEFKPQA